MKKNTSPSPVLRRLLISNYKGIENIELAFPSPRFADEPNAVIIGSKNGIGKTSVLECGALLWAAAWYGEKTLFPHPRTSSLNILDLLIRAGAQEAILEGDFFYKEKEHRLKLIIQQKGIICEPSLHAGRGKPLRDDFLETILPEICGLTTDPFLSEHMLFFHSYRKVQEGSPALGMMVDTEMSPRMRRPMSPWDRESVAAAFKLTIVRSLMSRAELFEMKGDSKSGGVIEVLNTLVQQYAGGSIGKLRPSKYDTLDIRITSGEHSFSFDGLSSGQKEIISTLFLIWQRTKESPSIVFIDEPELHLNTQWHSDFIATLSTLAPWNQYIIATHSESIMGSVPEEQRILLVSGTGGGKK